MNTAANPITIIFNYSGEDDAALRAHDGQEVTILRPLGPDEADAEVGIMYRIRFADGFESDAFRDELDGFDVDAFIDGMIECALWADAIPYTPSATEIDRDTLAEYAVEHGASIGYVKTVPDNVLRAEYGEACAQSLRDNMDTGGQQGHLHDLQPGVRGKLADDAVAFVDHNLHLLVEYAALRDFDPSQGKLESFMGHDFHLSRCHHGTGFWDRGAGKVGDALHEAAEPYGETPRLYVEADGTVITD